VPWSDLLVLAGWGVAGLLVAVARFSWLPVDRGAGAFSRG
jgi:hypothetical protein